MLWKSKIQVKYMLRSNVKCRLRGGVGFGKIVLSLC